MKIDLHRIDKAQEGKMFHSILYCIYKDMGKTKYGDSFIKLTLKDATGSIDGKLWENCTYFDQKFDEGDIYDIMLMLIHGGWKITIARLARGLDCSTRTIHRNMGEELKREKELLNQQITN